MSDLQNKPKKYSWFYGFISSLSIILALLLLLFLIIGISFGENNDTTTTTLMSIFFGAIILILGFLGIKGRRKYKRGKREAAAPLKQDCQAESQNPKEGERDAKATETVTTTIFQKQDCQSESQNTKEGEREAKATEEAITTVPLKQDCQSESQSSKTEERPLVVEKEEETSAQRGVAIPKEVKLNSDNESNLRNCFIAFDVETTGLDPISDRIIEVGAVVFQNGNVQKSFSSLINPGISISHFASSVNHITNSMLDTAPSEKEVYPQLIEFLGDALHGKIVMCAHNAKFDFNFLCNTLSRLGINAEIEYIDTLNLSRRYLHGLENYQQNTVETHLGLTNSLSHRASSDAENCGHILYHLLDVAHETLEKEKRKFEQSKPNQQELEVCAFVQNIILQRGADTKLLGFRKNSSGYVDVCCLYTFLKIKFTKKGSYILIKSDCPEVENYVTEPCTQGEGGTDYVRVYFSSPFDLEPLSEYIFKAFSSSQKSMEDYTSYSKNRRQEAENYIQSMCSMTNDEMSSLLNEIKEHDYAPIPISIANKQQVSRDDVEIHAVNNRVPLSEILNLDDWHKGFDMGHPYWEKGDNERKKGNLTVAIELFDKARLNGYLAPVLYDSYAMAYRQLKDYSNEIAILDEGIARMPEKESIWSVRRNKAISLLFTQQEKERNTVQKAQI